MKINEGAVDALSGVVRSLRLTEDTAADLGQKKSFDRNREKSS